VFNKGQTSATTAAASMITLDLSRIANNKFHMVLPNDVISDYEV
jgi:hypothetical protein